MDAQTDLNLRYTCQLVHVPYAGYQLIQEFLSLKDMGIFFDVF